MSGPPGPVLAMHPEDIVAIAAVLLVWVALRRLAGRRRRWRPPAERQASRLDHDA